MLIHDDRYHWKGWGGALRLGSGVCRLRIFDLKKSETGALAHLKSTIVVLEEIEDKLVSIRSVVGHIATSVSKDFNIEPARMLLVEYYPAVTYGERQNRSIKERYEAVEFTWHGDKALNPRWRPLPEPMVQMIKEMAAAGGAK